ncbi:hypothetical protein F5Y11DRAFT_322048 [Daldinia sp. FL1419]|nr:hypothetical protein F5Y11DRAFT_322048 [Daldinia sp. FL1419]
MASAGLVRGYSLGQLAFSMAPWFAVEFLSIVIKFDTNGFLNSLTRWTLLLMTFWTIRTRMYPETRRRRDHWLNTLSRQILYASLDAGGLVLADIRFFTNNWFEMLKAIVIVLLYFKLYSSIGRPPLLPGHWTTRPPAPEPPVIQTPMAQTPTAQTPAAQTPTAQTPTRQRRTSRAPVIESPIVRQQAVTPTLGQRPGQQPQVIYQGTDPVQQKSQKEVRFANPVARSQHEQVQWIPGPSGTRRSEPVSVTNQTQRVQPQTVFPNPYPQTQARSTGPTGQVQEPLKQTRGQRQDPRQESVPKQSQKQQKEQGQQEPTRWITWPQAAQRVQA